jgi:hypothetical protein
LLECLHLEALGVRVSLRLGAARIVEGGKVLVSDSYRGELKDTLVDFSWLV